MIDMTNLTIGELALIEDLSGQPLAAMSDPERPKMKLLAAVALVVKRRSGTPTFTWNAALALPMGDVNELLGIENDEPEPAPGEPIPAEAIELSDAEGEGEISE